MIQHFKRQLFASGGRLKKRHMLLLEIMISLALIVLCALPLIAPHVAIIKDQRAFITTVELDHAVNLMYVELLERLHRNDIRWKEIEDGREFPIEGEMWKRIGIENGLPFQGSYRLKFKKIKQDNEKTWGVGLGELVFTFVPLAFVDKEEGIKKQRTLQYTYHLLIGRVPKGTDNAGEDAADKPKEEQKQEKK